MLRATRRLRPACEPLEGRQLLSTAADHHVHVAAQVVRAPRLHFLALNGHVDGTYTVAPSLAAPAPAVVRASGRVRPLGQADLTGVLTALPSVSNATLDMTLSNRRGSVLIRIEPGATPVNPSVDPMRFRYTIVAGSGAYRNTYGAGVALVSLDPDRSTLGSTGGFRLTLRPDGQRLR